MLRFFTNKTVFTRTLCDVGKHSCQCRYDIIYAEKTSLPSVIGYFYMRSFAIFFFFFFFFWGGGGGWNAMLLCLFLFFFVFSDICLTISQ